MVVAADNVAAAAAVATAGASKFTKAKSTQPSGKRKKQ